MNLEPTLYVHVKRADWGYGVLASEEPHRKRFHFEHGGMRTIGEGYYDMVREVEAPPVNARAIVADLSHDLDASRARQRRALFNPGANKTLRSLDEQIELFKGTYPKGFDDDKWLEEHRGVGINRALKRHRAPVLSKANELFEAARAGTFPSSADLAGVLAKTDLVSVKKDVGLLKKLATAETQKVLEAVFVCTNEDKNLLENFDSVVEALQAGGPVSWPLPSTLVSLAAPSKMIPIRPATFRRQAMWMAPELDHKKTPSGAHYVKYLAMAKAVERALFRASMEPADLIDVFDFMVLTTKPKVAR